MRYFNLYRLALGTLFVVLAVGGQWISVLGVPRDALSAAFAIVAGLYLALAITAAAAIETHRPEHNILATILVSIDVLAITLLMHASGGIRSGLGILLVVSVAAGALLVSGRMAILFAALASIAVLAQQIASSVIFDHPPEFMQAGLLGGALFATAGVGYELARVARRNAVLADDRARALAELAQLNEQIIQRMRTGIIVVDDTDRVLLANHSARELLGADIDAGTQLHQGSPEIAERLHGWRLGDTHWELLDVGERAQRCRVSFAELGGAERPRTILFVEDAAALRQEAQMLKMSLLGTLVASIAHQVRTPLGAISHAVQLLAEGDLEDHEQARLTGIVQRHSQRVNEIIEEVLEIGRERRFDPQSFELGLWLRRFVDDYLDTHQLAAETIALSVAGPLHVRSDRGQLSQVLSNLCDNALKHGRDASGEARIELRAHTDELILRPVIELRDHGPGISASNVAELFQPFHTTHQAGTGLGLYVARELCEINQARLEHFTPADGCGTGFRIIFADPRKRQWV